MFRFKETVLPFDRTISNSLKKIYGVGNQKGFYLANLFGFSDRYSINLINLHSFECMT
jgi:ribosomal protein S13